ncbi:MAG: aminoglycoside 3-N-acetyltransferase [Fimbriimonadaceae bacterium]|jgi:aminoglycoside 3-N-acetyltransferase|nr:aminoglycoside 3-N-acetyltransferase [Fimbriimonadaceae bacterium]
MSVVTADDIGSSFRAAGVGAGDTLCLHSDAIVLAQMAIGTPQERADSFINALEDLLGPEGTLVVPTFTYSFTEGKPYDPSMSPSKVGVLTEMFRVRQNVLRTRDPIFSFAVSGSKAREYASASVEESFGDKSAFALLQRDNAWIACLGCALDRVTFVHRVEQIAGVDYRYPKVFSGEVIENGRQTELKTTYLVRDLERATQTDLRLLQSKLIAEGKLNLKPVGRIALLTVRAQDFLASALELLKTNPSGLIKEGAAS